jgi:periplasmic protein TonB
VPAYRLPSAYDRHPLRRRASGLALALGLNLLLLLVLLGMGKFAPVAQKASQTLSIDLLPESRPAAHQQEERNKPIERPRVKPRPAPKPPPIVLPVRPTITPPPSPQPWIEMTKEEMAAADVRNLPKADAGAGGRGDSEVVGKGPHGETLYAAEWAREPTDAELSGYLPHNLQDGWGLIACKTIPGNRVEDCVELGQSPAGSHLASAVRQAAWQFRVRPPRKNGRPLVGEWVQIRIDYEFRRTTE